MARKPINIPKPENSSHKGQNGVILIIGGSGTYHGAPILAAKAAVRFCDLVYFSSTSENNGLIRRMKLATPNVICIPEARRKEFMRKADCILIGNGMDVSFATESLVSAVLKTGKKCVIDAAALRVVRKEQLHGKAIVTPHALEFKAAFGLSASGPAAKKMSKKYNCTILLKGPADTVASNGKASQIAGGNAGMTKGGTGDVLAGLLCALYSRSSDPFASACTASYLNKKAGEILFRVMGAHFSSEDLADELSFVAAAAEPL